MATKKRITTVMDIETKRKARLLADDKGLRLNEYFNFLVKQDWDNKTKN